jgi:hypothetical protein
MTCTNVPLQDVDLMKPNVTNYTQKCYTYDKFNCRHRNDKYLSSKKRATASAV